MPRCQKLKLALTPALHALLARAAASEGQTLEEFVTQAAQRAAVATVRTDKVIELSKRAQRAVAEALLNPPPPNAAMKRAFLRHKKYFGY